MKWIQSDRPLVEAAMGAFQRGDWQAARDHFTSAIATGRADAGAYALLATACQRLGEHKPALEAANEALRLDPRQLRATLVKAEVLADQGARQDANMYFGAVIALGEQMGAVSPDLQEGLARARAWRDALKIDMEDHVRARLETAGYSRAHAPARFTEALDVLTGRRKPYVQQPRYFYYPNLPTVEFYPRDQFPWLSAIEAATEEITHELVNVLRGDEGFVPYVQSQANMRYNLDTTLLDSLDWSSCFLWKDGVPTQNLEKCPRTLALLESAPLCRVDGRSPLIMFSQLKAGARIPPHTGVLNTRLLCHLPLIVPPGCMFRVGNETREWKRGEAWLFNDSIEHEAHNPTDQTRVILIFDVWRPELSQEEQILIRHLLEAMDGYAPRMDWD